MKINIGSKSAAKVSALKELLREYDFLSEAEVVPVSVASNVSEQPKSLEETVQGAINRAKNAFRDCDYSVGIESGIASVPQAKRGFMNICACVVYDGRQHHLGLSSAFEYPERVVDHMIGEGLSLAQAFHKAGYAESPEIVAKNGVISFLTKGRIDRKEYTKQSIINALIHLENSGRL